MLFKDDLKVIAGGIKEKPTEKKIYVDTNKVNTESQRYKLYKIIKDLAWFRDRITTTDLDYILGFPLGTIKSWSVIRAPKSRLSKVAEYFGISVSGLYKAEDFRDLL